MFFFEHLICHIKQGADILAICIVLRGPAPDVCIKKILNFEVDTAIYNMIGRGKYMNNIETEN